MRRVALLVVVLTVLLVPAIGAAQTDTVDTGPDTRIHITVQEDGDARWDVTVRIPLENETDARAFETLRAEFAAGNADETLSVDPFREAADRVSERTGQSMRIAAVERTTDVQTVDGTDVGHLTLSFTWTNFAVTDEDQIRVGTTFGSGWFGDLGPDQRLLIEPPEGYQVHTVEPPQSIESGVLQWDGPQTFGPGQPVVTFTPVAPGPLPVAVPFAASIALVVGAILGALFLVGWRRGAIQDTIPGAASTETDSTTTETETSPDEPTTSGDEEPRPPEAGAATVPPSEGAEEAEETAEETEPEEGLLSDEERVERLLRENDGRMKQARIVEETRWSNAKVSQLLSSMAEEGRIEKLRLGRENLISLPDEESDLSGPRGN